MSNLKRLKFDDGWYFIFKRANNILLIFQDLSSDDIYFLDTFDQVSEVNKPSGYTFYEFVDWLIDWLVGWCLTPTYYVIIKRRHMDAMQNTVECTEYHGFMLCYTLSMIGDIYMLCIASLMWFSKVVLFIFEHFCPTFKDDIST